MQYWEIKTPGKQNFCVPDAVLGNQSPCPGNRNSCAANAVLGNQGPLSWKSKLLRCQCDTGRSPSLWKSTPQRSGPPHLEIEALALPVHLENQNSLPWKRVPSTVLGNQEPLGNQDPSLGNRGSCFSSTVLGNEGLSPGNARMTLATLLRSQCGR